MAGSSGTPRARILGIKPGARVVPIRLQGVLGMGLVDNTACASGGVYWALRCVVRLKDRVR